MLNSAAFGSSTVVKLRQIDLPENHPADVKDGREEVENLRRRLAQAELAAHEALLFSRELMQEITDLISRRGDETKDTFLRHHLNMVAHDIAALSKTADQTSNGLESCLYRTLSSETASMLRRHPTRFSPVSRQVRLVKFTPAKSADAIFAHLVRYLLNAVVQCEASRQLIEVWLEQKRDTLVLHLDGIKYTNEQELLSYVTYPKRIRALMGALDARLERAREGAAVVIPLRACL